MTKSILNLNHIRLNKQLLFDIQSYCIDHKIDTKNMHILYKNNSLIMAFDSSGDNEIVIKDYQWEPSVTLH